MSTFNIVLMQADFSANYLKKGTPVIASEITADAIIELLSKNDEQTNDALRVFFYQLKQAGVFAKVKTLIMPCIASDINEAKRNWINLDSYEIGISQTDYGEHKGLVFDDIQKTIYRGGTVQAANNKILNPNNILKIGNVSACYCTRGQEVSSKIHIVLTGQDYTSLTDTQTSFWENNKNNAVIFGPVESNVNNPIVGTWKCSDNDGTIMGYSGSKTFAQKNTNPTEWANKNLIITDFGSIAVDTPTRFILLSEALTKEEMINLYDIVNSFLNSL